MADFMRPAGKSGIKNRGSAKDCMVFPDRCSASPRLEKFRKSRSAAPGVRFQHHGTVDDYAALNLDELTFGEVNSDQQYNTAANLIHGAKLGEVEKINVIKSEAIYRLASREPLGRSLERGTVMPSKFKCDNVPFGIPPNSDRNSAKNVLYPTLEEDSSRGEELYRRTHGSYKPGEQKTRGYAWHGEDPKARTYGVKSEHLAYNGVSPFVFEALGGRTLDPKSSEISNKRAEDYRDAQPVLGKAKNLHLGSENNDPNIVFGRPSFPTRTGGRGRITAGEIMKGEYNKEHRKNWIEMDRDLGTAIMPGYRNITWDTAHTYGCATVRSDLSARPPSSRSVADSQNYGDDGSARDIIHPNDFSRSLLSPAVNQLKSKSAIYHLFLRIGYDLLPFIFETIFAVASRGGEECSINQFRNVLNDYLNAVDCQKEHSWLSSRNDSLSY